MKRLTVLLLVLLQLFSTAAMARSIYSENAADYADKLKEAYDKSSISLFSDTCKGGSPDAERTLMVDFAGELNDTAALCDVYDKYNIHTLVYESKTDADAAYKYYSKNGIPVYRDELISADNLSWGYSYIGTSAFTSGLTASYGSTGNMPSVTVAVIDSGVDYTHPFLSDRVNHTAGYDFYNSDGDAMDDNRHGTHVAGIIADNTLSNVTILPIKAMSASGNSDTSILRLSISYAIDSGADIINMSLGSQTEDTKRQQKSLFNPLFSAARSKGITICCAAGNAYQGVARNSDYIFPAYMDNNIVVANCTNNGSISDSSNYGTVVDISAPGTNIYSTVIGSKYAYMSGTSMACPFAAAAAALLKTKNPNITPAQIESELRSNATPYSAELYDSYQGKYGTGTLNISNYYLDGATPAPTSSPTPIPTAAPTAEPGSAQLFYDISYADGRISGCIKNPADILGSDFYAFIAGYKDGVTIKIKPITISDIALQSDDAAFDTYFDSDKSNYDSIRIFVWRSLGSMLPLSLPYTVK